ncbi:hypothetical protein L798_13854 [Zootermopsis nevadensis]|uniref:Uncharacterized protein n=1 Tax=Zootermopsis nevadensis TaxID=136037 RepID=A0A067QT87_ZOONE|nr:hypothetical protein L798_13854 [Zootermopsis nevadensis]
MEAACSPKLPTSVQGVTTQKTNTAVFTAVTASNLTHNIDFLSRSAFFDVTYTSQLSNATCAEGVLLIYLLSCLRNALALSPTWSLQTQHRTSSTGTVSPETNSTISNTPDAFQRSEV